MQQYFVTDIIEPGAQMILEKDAAHHITKVMRNKVGQKIRIISQDTPYLASIVSMDQQEVLIEINEQLDEKRELDNKITIALGILKGDKLEYAIQKCTELGMSGFIPWESTYTIAKVPEKKRGSKTKRWQTIAQEASEQSQRHSIPKIYEPMNTKSLIEKFEQFDEVYIAYEGLALEQEKQMNLQEKKGTILLVIGPEGGISEKELESFKHAGAKAMRLGSRILRAETAAMFFMALMSGCEEVL